MNHLFTASVKFAANCRNLLAICLVFFFCSTFAQAPQLRFKHLTINNGLSQNTVFCIYQDHKGFIWFGTEDGLNRYDGYEFKVFKNELNNKRSLLNNQVNVITEDEDKQLIIGTGGGLSFFNRNTEDFTNVVVPRNEKDLQSSNFVTSLVFSGNQMWIGTYDGVKLYDLRQKGFVKANLPKGSSGNNVQTLFKDNNGNLWLSYRNDLRLLDKHHKIKVLPTALSTSFGNDAVNVRVIKQDKDGSMWFGTEHSGLYYLSRDHKISRNYRYKPGNSNSLPVDVVRDIHFNKDGKIWVATRKGLSIFDPKTLKFSTAVHDKYDEGSLSHSSILRILPDRLGNIWIGTYAGGVNIYHPANLNFSVIGEQVGSRLGLNNPVASSIVHEQNGGLWIGTEGGGINYLNRTNGSFAAYSMKTVAPTSENIVKTLAKDRQGNIWVGAFDGLYHFNKANKSFTAYPLKRDDNYRGRNQIYALLVDSLGLWIGTNGGGLVYLNDVSRTEQIFVNSYRDKASLIGNNVTALTKDKNGGLWIGTLQGLCYLVPTSKQFKRFVHEEGNRYSLTANNIICVFIDSKNRLWVGTRGGGLNLYDRNTGKFFALTEKDGLANNVIRAINEDQAGRIWVSSNKGISVFDPATLNIKKPSSQSFKNFTITDGLQSNQFLSNATSRLPNGELLFGGINGLSTFFPDKLVGDKMVSPIAFTDFFINNKKVDYDDEDSPVRQNIDEHREFTLPYDQAYITIKFAMLNYQNTAKNSYAYKLAGFGKDDWHYVNDQRTATYTNLNAGKYVFMVKAANGDGVWSKRVDQLVIHVLPPWYKTWWAYISYTLVIIGLLYLFYYFSYKTAKLKNELDFEQLSHEKDQELAQRKLSFFTHISHEIKTPLTLIISPIEKLLSATLDQKVQNQLQLIYRNGERLMHLTNQLLDYRKFETGNMKLQAAEGNMVRFCKEVMAAFQSYASHKQIGLKLSATQKSIRVWFDRDKMEKVMYNLISNALKFTPEGGFILISVRQGETNSVLVEVEDNGIGIAPENLGNIFNQFQYYNTNGVNSEGTGLGLSFAKGLVELHHGKISVVSSPGLTRFTVELPLGNEHLSAFEIIKDYSNSEDISTYGKAEPLKLTEQTVTKKKQILSLNDTQALVMLVVEDNPEVLQFVASHFADEFKVITAVDGSDGWNKAIDEIPDIIISDVMMPNTTGTELCARLKNDVRTSHIPVILLTARETLLYKLEGLETGADDYIVKPFNLRHLEVRIWNLLESRIKLREKYSRDLTLQPTNVPITSVDEKFLAAAMKYIEANMAESSLGVEGLSKEVGMSKATLYRKLKALTNQNTNEFIRTIRLNRAAQLLKQHKLNVSEVAYQVGFNDQDYFRKCFKEQFGCTPKEFANKTI